MKETRTPKRRKAMCILAVSLLFQAVSLILYRLTGVTEFSPVLDPRVFALGGASLLLGALAWCAGRLTRQDSLPCRLLDVGLYGVYALALAAWLFFLVSQVNYLTNIFVSIDGTKLSPAFLFTVLCFLAAWVTALIAAFIWGKPEASTNTEGGISHA